MCIFKFFNVINIEFYSLINDNESFLQSYSKLMTESFNLVQNVPLDEK